MPIASPLMAVAHLIAFFLVVLGPVLGYRQAHRTPDSRPDAKRRRYRWLVVRQLVIFLVLIGWFLASDLPADRLGLGAPHVWWLTILGMAVIGGWMGRTALTLRRRAGAVREQLQSRAGALLLPDSNDEARWFVLVCLCGGLAEEIGYRGFLFYYLLAWFPGLNALELVLVTSICFGIAHVYQGWRGVAVTSVAGLLMGGLYVATASLLLPVFAHVLGNLRAVVIFWTPTRDGA